VSARERELLRTATRLASLSSRLVTVLETMRDTMRAQIAEMEIEDQHTDADAESARIHDHITDLVDHLATINRALAKPRGEK
jgi:hypothetical protein